MFVVGDSVVNGGVMTDHKDLATTVLTEQMKIQVCNVSAGSWGPGNYAAYFSKFKNLVSSNDVLVLVVNSHDLWEDDPAKTKGANVGKDIALPMRKPFCALFDGFYRYFIPVVRKKLGQAVVMTKVDVPKWQIDSKNELALYNLSMLSKVFDISWKRKYMLIHRSRKEMISNVITSGECAFREYAKRNGIAIIELLLCEEDYRDAIHLSVSGQRKMAEAIWKALE